MDAEKNTMLLFSPLLSIFLLFFETNAIPHLLQCPHHTSAAYYDLLQLTISS